MVKITTHILKICIGLALSATACVPSAAPRTVPPPPPTATVMEISQRGTLDVSFLVTPGPFPTTEATPVINTSVPIWQETTEQDAPAISYVIDATLNYADNRVNVALQVDFRNDADTELDSLVFYVPPNKQPGAFELGAVTVDSDQLAPATLEGTRLTIALGHPLKPSEATHATVTYELALLPIGGGYFPQHGYLGHGDHQLNLGHWLPLIPHFDGGEWITPIPVNIGEQETLPSADFSLSLTIENRPRGLTVVGPGDVSRSSNTWEFRLRQARDLAVTLSTEYHRIVTVAPNGVQIELYTLDDAQPSEGAQFDGPLHALETASAALELFADLYGPYPHNRLVVVESEFPDGMEFSGIVFVGGEWFRSYSGDPASYLTLITAHEVAHQWWYDLVGSNQSAEPWLDESLCTYSEFVFLEENYPQLTDWWWRFRVYSWGPDGLVDSSVYAFDNTRAYINAVYLRGATLLHELRAVMGGETFFAWLNTYASTMKGQIADANDLWHAMSDDALQRTTEIRKRFLRHPGGTE